jgi:malate permease and related proteins
VGILPGVSYVSRKVLPTVLEILGIFVDNIAPILIITAIAYVVGKRFAIDPHPISRLLLYVLSPALIFKSMSTTQISGAELAQIGVATIIFFAAMGTIAYWFTRWQEGSPTDKVAVIVGALCPNDGNFGLPLVNFAFGPEIFSRAVIVYIIVTLLNYTAGIYVASSGKYNARQALRNVFRLPTIYAALLGLVINIADYSLPAVLERSSTLVANATIPVMIILLGLQLAQQSAQISQPKLLGTGVGLRLLASPVLAAAIVMLLGLNPAASVALIMQASMPTAVVTIIFATEFGLNRQLSLGLILGSTLLSPVTLSILIYLLR